MWIASCRAFAVFPTRRPRHVEYVEGAGDLIPNQSVLINAIPILKAQANSEIENIAIDLDAIADTGLKRKSGLKRK